MATKFEEIYCLASNLKKDNTVARLPYYQLLELLYNDLIIGKSRFVYDCHSDLDDYTKFDVLEFFYNGNGVDNEFEINGVDYSLNLYIGIKNEYDSYFKEITNYSIDSLKNVVILDEVPEKNSEIIISFYNNPEFASDLKDVEKTILAHCMQIAYYQRMLGNTNSLEQVYTSNSFDIHSQAYQIEKLKSTLSTIELQCDDLIKDYSWRTSKDKLKGLAGRGRSGSYGCSS